MNKERKMEHSFDNPEAYNNVFCTEGTSLSCRYAFRYHSLLWDELLKNGVASEQIMELIIRDVTKPLAELMLTLNSIEISCSIVLYDYFMNPQSGPIRSGIHIDMEKKAIVKSTVYYTGEYKMTPIDTKELIVNYHFDSIVINTLISALKAEFEKS